MLFVQLLQDHTKFNGFFFWLFLSFCLYERQFDAQEVKNKPYETLLFQLVAFPSWIWEGGCIDRNKVLQNNQLLLHCVKTTVFTSRARLHQYWSPFANFWFSQNLKLYTLRTQIGRCIKCKSSQRITTHNTHAHRTRRAKKKIYCYNFPSICSR